ncbi:MAG: arsenate reductase ArsC [Gemmatimonadota bacterium]
MTAKDSPSFLRVLVSEHPEAREVASRLRAVAGEVAPELRAEVEVAPAGDADAPPRAEAAGVDLFAFGAPPPSWLLEAAVLRALAPRHILFLCVANSARSQMGEGLARALAPVEVKISSAGSEPTRVRPQAVRALAEVGVDITRQRSKGTDEVDPDVDAVVTLCAEEVCPAWLGKAWRVHWGLPDPAGAGASPEEEMEAFRSVRDELRERLTVLFRGTQSDAEGVSKAGSAL